MEKINKLAKEIVENLVACDSAEPEAVDQYEAWTQKRLEKAFRALEQRAEAAEAKLADMNKPSFRDEEASFELRHGESEYDRLRRMYEWMKAKPEPAINLTPVSNCLSFFASVIKSGESWSATCQRDLDAAREALRNAEEAK